MLNRIKKLILPEDVDNENKEIVPTYNRSGGLEKVHLDGDEYVKEIAYDAKGQRLLISFGNGVMNRYAYDAQNFRLKRMKSEKYTYSESATERTYEVLNGTTRQDIGYEYDLNGNILKKKNRTPDCGISGTALGVDGLDNQYTYDAISRLLSATGRESDANNESHRWADAPAAGSPNASKTQSYNRQYTYDKVGNVKTLQQTGTNAFTRTFNYTANTLNNITVSGTPTAFMHDANGNMTQSSSSRYYEWNEHNQLVFFKVQAGGTPSVYAHYLYDSGGNRTKKIVWDQQGNKEVTVYIDGVFEYRLKQEGATEKEQNIIHVMDDSTRIAQLRVGTAFTDDISEEAHYILDDHLGSSNARLNNTGSIIDRQEYYPFGDTSLRTFSRKRYQYVGKEKDAESGLSYYGARYYAAWTCRFISVDPLAGSYSQLTPYNYTNNGPIDDVDIDGMQDTTTSVSPSSTNSELPAETPQESGELGIIHFIDVNTGKFLGSNNFGGVGESIRSITNSNFIELSENNFDTRPGVAGFQDSEISVLKDSSLVTINQNKIDADLKEITKDKFNENGDKIENGLFLIFDKSQNVLTSEINMNNGSVNSLNFTMGEVTNSKPSYNVFVSNLGEVFNNKIIVGIIHTHPSLSNKVGAIFGSESKFKFEGKGEEVLGPGASDIDFDFASNKKIPNYAIATFEENKNIYYANQERNNYENKTNALTNLSNVLEGRFNLVIHSIIQNYVR